MSNSTMGEFMLLAGAFTVALILASAMSFEDGYENGQQSQLEQKFECVMRAK